MRSMRRLPERIGLWLSDAIMSVYAFQIPRTDLAMDFHIIQIVCIVIFCLQGAAILSYEKIHHDSILRPRA